MRYHNFLILGITIAFLLSCYSKEQEVSLPFEGQLAFIEDLDGSGGVLAGKFGDLVLLDGSQNLRRLLTNDHYYNDHPSWSMSGNSIWFESKRSKNIGTAGLSVDSYLYKVDLKGGPVKKVSSLPKFVSDSPYNASKPSISQLGNKIIFFSPLDHTIYADFKNYESKNLYLKGINNFKWWSKFTWSPDDNKLAFRISKKGFVYDIGILSLENDSVEIITNTFHNGPHSGKNAINCELGNWTPSGKAFIYSCSELGEDKSKIYSYRLDTEKSTLLKNVEKHIVYSPQISADEMKIFYIAGDGNAEWNDIYMFDIKNDNFIQITSNQNRKRHLIYRPIQN